MITNLTVFYPGEPGTYSIRRVSEALLHRLPSNIHIQEYVLPGKDASIRSIIKNILFVFAKCTKKIKIILLFLHCTNP